MQTEDHPYEYAWFEGTIPKGQYGAGNVKIWDIGTCEIEKWRDDEVIAVLYGRAGGGLGGVPRRYALIRTEGENWLLKFMKRQPPAEPHGRPEPEAPGATEASGGGRKQTPTSMSPRPRCWLRRRRRRTSGWRCRTARRSRTR
nr:DNA polymerase ligase N-terminal domain-containing protein [Corynebacterium aquatimens]